MCGFVGGICGYWENGCVSARLDEVLDYSVSNIPREKIVLALPNYGYDWGPEGGEPMQYHDIMERLVQYGVQPKRDKESYALLARYLDDGNSHTIWFEDSVSIAAKVERGKDYGISQFSFWSLGGEDRGVWEEL